MLLQSRVGYTASADHHLKQAQRQALITALNENRVNTIAELRRIERVFAQLCTDNKGA